MRPKLAIALLLIVFSLLILAELAKAEESWDERSGLHLGASAGIGMLTGVATQEIEDATTRRLTAFGLCMVPGVAKELSDGYVSTSDLVWDGVGCIAGIAIFEGVQLMLSDKSIRVAGRW